jgi:hypothetical protein
MSSKVLELRAKLAAIVLVEVHGTEASLYDPEKLVFKVKDKQYGLDDLLRATLTCERNLTGNEGLSDEELAASILRRLASRASTAAES